MRERVCGIYYISNDYFFYIGQSIDIYKRWTAHKSKLRKDKHENIIMQRVYNKHSEDFNYNIVITCSEERLTDMENTCKENYLKLFPDKQCMNIASCYQTWSEYSRKKASASHTGRTFSEERKLNISNGQRGCSRLSQRVPIVQLTTEGNLIKEWSSITLASKELQININLNRKTSGGYIWKRLKDYNPNDNNKVIYNTEISVKQYTKDGQFVEEWSSITAASKALNIKHCNISNALHGKQKTAGGYIWK